ncbi:hypothetical protein [Lachnospira sp.]|uniref:hypothetical protein n=1 Tax=Lachnospira sp. TaxID=2049031 RepID=UPI0025796CB6|nr:hypothetical protein [Lachnospira sp.]
MKGISIPKYLVSNISEDLIILKSHKLEDINNTLQEYIYNVVLGNEGGELLDIIN